MLKQLLAKSPARRAASALHEKAVLQARREPLYAVMGAPDTVEGRFELLTLHVILLIERLKGEPGAAAEVRQMLFDTYVSNLDGALREMGVGDLAVSKRMRKLGEVFYGRAQAYDEAFALLPDRTALGELLGRTVLQGAPVAPTLLADYVTRRREGLAATDTRALVSGEASWPAA